MVKRKFGSHVRAIKDHAGRPLPLYLGCSMAAQMLFKSACNIVFSLRRVARYGLQFCEYLILSVSVTTFVPSASVT